MNNAGVEQPSWQANQSAQNYEIEQSYANKYESTHADNYDQYDQYNQYDQSDYNNNGNNQQYQQYENYQ